MSGRLFKKTGIFNHTITQFSVFSTLTFSLSCWRSRLSCSNVLLLSSTLPSNPATFLWLAAAQAASTLAWPRRWAGIQREVETHQPDLLALQEVGCVLHRICCTVSPVGANG